MVYIKPLGSRKHFSGAVLAVCSRTSDFGRTSRALYRVATLAPTTGRQRPDGNVYDHEAHAFGLFANANLGWTF